MKKDFSNIAISINPIVFKFISSFFTEKSTDDFIIQSFDEQTLRIFPANTPVLADSRYYFEISSTGCDFVFNSLGKNIYLEILNEFDDIEDYFQIDYHHGSKIAELLKEKYRAVYQQEIASGDDLELDEDFNLGFLDNFVHCILNDVHIEQ